MVGSEINDRCCFVVDEVGNSSKIQIDALSHNQSKFDLKTINEEFCQKRDNNVSDIDFYAKDMASKIEISDNNSIVKSAEDGTTDYVTDCEKNDDSATSEGEGKKPEPISLSTTSETQKLQNSFKLECQNSDVIDMDIDYDSEDVECNIVKEIVTPIIKISFRDAKIESIYKSSIMECLDQIVRPCTVVTNSENELEIEIYKEETQNDLVDNEGLGFDLDTTPSCESQKNKVPYYGKNQDIILSDTNTVTFSETEVPSVLCFNCCGKHNLRDCQQSKNLKAINRNRSKFQAANKFHRSRYHCDESQRFGKFVPGELSKKLRNALNLRRDQQAHFIYKMRLLGYPPAWLEEARVSHSGVAIYDGKGVPILEEDQEEGEIVTERSKDRYDISKIVEFPGFNVPLPKNMKEEGKLHGCPGISEKQSKENLIKILQPNAVQAYKKRSLSLQKYTTKDEFVTEKESLNQIPSPTIEQMEEKKRQLLLDLNDENQKEQDESNSFSAQDNLNLESKSIEMAKDSRSLKNSDFGTPILKSISPFSKLPSREKFSVNISDLINFKNLPDSTGKYEKMSCIIHKIRDKVSKINNDD